MKRSFDMRKLPVNPHLGLIEADVASVVSIWLILEVGGLPYSDYRQHYVYFMALMYSSTFP